MPPKAAPKPAVKKPAGNPRRPPPSGSSTVLSLRVTRDKRGYEHIYLLAEGRRRGKADSRLVYWCRMPGGLVSAASPSTPRRARAWRRRTPIWGSTGLAHQVAEPVARRRALGGPPGPAGRRAACGEGTAPAGAPAATVAAATRASRAAADAIATGPAARPGAANPATDRAIQWLAAVGPRPIIAPMLLHARPRPDDRPAGLRPRRHRRVGGRRARPAAARGPAGSAARNVSSRDAGSCDAVARDAVAHAGRSGSGGPGSGDRLSGDCVSGDWGSGHRGSGGRGRQRHFPDRRQPGVRPTSSRATTSGQFVADLKKDDFEVFEDGVQAGRSSRSRWSTAAASSTSRRRRRRRRRKASSCRRRGRPTTPPAASSCSSSTICTSTSATPAASASCSRRCRRNLIHDGDMWGMVSTGPSSIAIDMTYDREALRRGDEEDLRQRR